jgi:hypothetical protein
MDIKKILNNILQKHIEVKKPSKEDLLDDDLEQNYRKKDEEELSEDHKQKNEKELSENYNKEDEEELERKISEIIDDTPESFWVSQNPSKRKRKSKRGEFYRLYGMTIDLNKKDDPKAKAIIDLMHIIRRSHTQNDIFDKLADVRIKENQLKNKKTSLISMINDSKSKISDKNKKIRFSSEIDDSKSKISDTEDSDSSSNQEKEKELTIEKKEDNNNNKDHLRLEELYIKAVAVSLLAESDGNSAIAKQILYDGGLDAIKKMDVTSLRTILDQLNNITPEQNIEL